ncbi:Ff.00g039820.m01.CDS01 [Fusarium sp. VM40]|nr:Ff.00g039820.m01.CDS01 [Fusarium sp. VM40]
MSLIRIAIAGATGNLGPAILTALRSSKLFDITVLTRATSTHKFPDDVKVSRVDYKNESSLIEALRDHKAVVSTLSIFGDNAQEALVDASIKAGVKRFIPSEFGSDTSNPLVAKIPIFAPKVQLQEYLKTKAREHDGFSYTFIFNGPFLDWGLAAGMLVDIKNKSATLRDGGDVLFSSSRLSTVGQAVVGVLSNLDATANRAVYVKDADVSQNQLISIAKELDPSGTWNTTEAETAVEEREALEKFNPTQPDIGVISKFLFRAIFGQGFGGRFETVDNELLGVKGLDAQGVKEVVKGVLGA